MDVELGGMRQRLQPAIDQRIVTAAFLVTYMTQNG